MPYGLCVEALSHASFPRTRIPVGFFSDSSVYPVKFFEKDSAAHLTGDNFFGTANELVS
jgi:hypothetical protein